MNRWEYTGNLQKGQTSRAAKCAFADMMSDECTLGWYDNLGTDMFMHVILSEKYLIN